MDRGRVGKGQGKLGRGGSSEREAASDSDRGFERLGGLLEQAGAVPGVRKFAAVPPPPASPDGEQAAARALAACWATAVGSEVAANAQPVQLRRGRLVVSVSSSEWAQTLHLMSEALVGRLKELLGPDAVEQVVFRHAGWEGWESPPGPQVSGLPPVEPSRIVRASEVALSPEQKDALAAVDRLDLAPALRNKIAQTMKAAFVRAQQDSVR